MTDDDKPPAATINRAIQAYDLVQDLLRGGDGRSLVIRYPKGETERVYTM